MGVADSDAKGLLD